MAAHTPTQPTVPQTVPIVILGTDAVLAALPATPVQLAHACLRAGFANVIPVSWGDELIAAAVLKRLPQFGNGPAIQCSCPIVAHRLLTVGGDLRPALLPLVPPPVALARYVRSLARPSRARITYVGACPGAVDESIDIRMTPESLIAMLAERDIILEEQPRVFESIIPPDRRRYRSQPGGVPAADVLWSELGSRTLVEIDGDDFVTEVAQHLLAGKNVLIDASARLGCACAGAVNGVSNPRAQVVSLEPPRATSPVVDAAPTINLEMPVPAAPRTPVDVVAVPTQASHSLPVTPPHGTDVIPPPRTNHPRGQVPTHEPRPSKLSAPVVPRSVLSAFPVARDTEGRALPRAYVVRRRSSPKGISVVVRPEESDAATPSEAASPGLEPAQSAPIVPTPVASDPVSPATAPAAAPAAAPVAAPAYSPVLSSSTTRATPAEAAAPEPAPTHRATPSSRPSNRSSYPESWSAPPPPPAAFSRNQIVLIVFAITLIVICASTVVSVIVARSMRDAPAVTP